MPRGSARRCRPAGRRPGRRTPRCSAGRWHRARSGSPRAPRAGCRPRSCALLVATFLGRGPERGYRRGNRGRRPPAGSEDIWLRRAVAREELLGIAPHAVLVDVEALELLLRAHAQANRLLAEVEDGDARGEHERGHDRDAEGLDAELVEAAAVEEAARAHAVELGERRRAEEAARERAPDAAHAVSGDRA